MDRGGEGVDDTVSPRGRTRSPRSRDRRHRHAPPPAMRRRHPPPPPPPPPTRHHPPLTISSRRRAFTTTNHCHTSTGDARQMAFKPPRPPSSASILKSQSSSAASRSRFPHLPLQISHKSAALSPSPTCRHPHTVLAIFWAARLAVAIRAAPRRQARHRRAAKGRPTRRCPLCRLAAVALWLLPLPPIRPSDPPQGLWTPSHQDALRLGAERLRGWRRALHRA